MNDDSKLHPGVHFATPGDVLTDASLSSREKADVLSSWANELRQLQVAEEENMHGRPELAGQLEAVEQALLALGETDVHHDAKA